MNKLKFAFSAPLNEFDNETETMFLYAEDAGLELLGKVVPGITLKDKTLVQMI